MGGKFAGQRRQIYSPPDDFLREFGSYDVDFGYMGRRTEKQTFSSPAFNLHADGRKYTVQIIIARWRRWSYFDSRTDRSGKKCPVEYNSGIVQKI